ncbi:MAG TPA: sulfatase [Myxococcota bacterium]|nr:sulfatase [Myxococcota bacterium]
MQRRRPHVLAGLAALALGAACAKPAPPRGLLLVTVDTLRADALGAYGAQGGLTPHLDDLAHDALVFDAAYAPAPFTYPSIAAILSGRYPGALGIQTNLSQIPPDVSTLASALAAHGFRTGAVVSSYVLRGKARLAHAFDIYDDTLSPSAKPGGLQERTAPATTDAALAALDRLLGAQPGEPTRFFLWVHYQDPHGPYTPPPELAARARALEPDAGRLEPLPTNHGGHGIPAYQVLGDEREVAAYRAAYHGEVAYLDAEIGRLLGGLADRKLRDETLVVFTADHGEALGEHDVFFAHGHDLTDELTHVPLFFAGPGVDPGRRSDVASLVDLYPTLLARLVGDPGAADLPGRDLLADGADERASVPYLDTLSYGATRRTGVVADGYKLILTWKDGVWQSRLYRKGHEDVDLGASAPQLTSALRDRLGDLQHQVVAEGRAELRQQLTPEERAQLQVLGYASDGAP